MKNDVFNSQPDDNQWFEDLMKKVKQESVAETDSPADPQPDHTILDEDWEKILQEAYDEDLQIPAAAVDPEPAETQAPESFQENDNGVIRKVRPKRKNGYGLFGLPHLAATAIWLALAIAIGISLGRFVWICATDLLAFGRNDRTVTLTITETDTLDTVTTKLQNAGLIEYPGLFKMYCGLAKVEEKEKISAGTFELNTKYDYHALVSGMSATSSYRQTIDVMIPEGYTCAQIFSLLEEKGVCSVQDLEAYASESEFTDYWFLEGVERGNKYCLEGFLFPDTYQFYTNDTPKRVFIKFLNRFDDQFTEEMQEELVTLNERLAKMYAKRGYSQSYIAEHKLTVLDLVTVASMVEKESAHSGESVKIASVIYNRLTSPNFPFLNIDATVVYALDGKKDLTAEDLKIDHPYNTYRYEGLPPGPISNPGQLNLKSALNPEDSSYYYYALDPEADSREHKFFKTYQEHLNFINGN